MNKNIAVQYTIVGIIILFALIWAAYRMFKQKKNSGGCSGCSLSDNCAKLKQTGSKGQDKKCSDK